MFLFMKRISFVGLLIIFFQGLLFADEVNSDDVTQKLKELHWVYGPKVVKVGDNATFKIPSGYAFLNPDDTEKILEIFHNPPSNRIKYFFAPKSLRWFGIFSYDDTGHIMDNETIDADSLIESIKEGTKEGNKIRIQKGWKPMNILGWKYKPFYDKNSNRLTWAIDAESGGIEVINYNTRILGRTGVTSAILVSGIDNLDENVNLFKDAVEGYQFNKDQQYSAFTEGDKVAKYGLAALIAGGAAAIATKKGLWASLLVGIKVFWKFILAGIAAFFGFFTKIFKKKDE